MTKNSKIQAAFTRSMNNHLATVLPVCHACSFGEKKSSYIGDFFFVVD